MTPRCFLTMAMRTGPRRTGGDIFSNVKAGIVYPLVVELKHSWSSPGCRRMNCLVTANRSIPSNADAIFKHNLCQIEQICAALRSYPRNPKVVTTMFEAHFQTFEEPESGVALTARLSAFREELARRKLTGFVIPRADQQQNEYVAPSEERLAWLTGFTGSAGPRHRADASEAAVFVDGRYTLQAAKQVDHQGLEHRAAGRPSPGKLAGEASRRRRPPRI